MAKYAKPADCVDPSVIVTAQHLTESDVYVDLVLGNIGLTPTQIAAITLPNATLTAISSTWAKRLSAIEGAIGENSPLIDKARQYQATVDALVKQLNRTSLGLTEPTGTGYGTLTLGRA